METKRSRITSFSLKIAKCPHTFLHILRRFFNTPHNRCFPSSTLWHFTRRFLKLCYFESFNARHSFFHDHYSFLSSLFPSFAFFFLVRRQRHQPDDNTYSGILCRTGRIVCLPTFPGRIANIQWNFRQRRNSFSASTAGKIVAICLLENGP